MNDNEEIKNELNINKLIYKSIGFGYTGNISKTNIVTIQDWIIEKYKLVPYIYWNYEKKNWKSYVYDYNYEPMKMLNKIKSAKKIEAKEASSILSKYVTEKFLVKGEHNKINFNTAEEALYNAIMRAYEIIKERKINETDKHNK